MSVIIMVILLAVVLGISGILVSQLKIIRGMENSVIALYAAESGIEQALTEWDNDPILYDGHWEILSNGARYDIIVLPSTDPNCSAGNYCIKSTGTFQNVKRAIQASY